MGGRASPRAGAEAASRSGTGPAYELIGKVAVMHEGRVKPLDTVAREEVKQVYGRETIKLRDPGEEIDKILDPAATHARPPPSAPVESWGPVGAFLGWTINPEFWDEQPFILVDYLPLRRRIMAETLATRLKAIAEKSTTPAAEKAALAKARGRPGADPRRARRRLPATSKLPIEDKQDDRRAGRQAERGAQVADPARARREPRSPIRSRCILPRLGQPSSRSSSGSSTPIPKSAARLTADREAGGRGRHAALDLQGLQRRAVSDHRAGPDHAPPEQRANTWPRRRRRSRKRARRKEDPATCRSSSSTSSRRSPLTGTTFRSDDRHDPTENAKFDERYTAWLRDNSVWVPLKVIFKSKPEELIEAGYPESQSRAFLDAYHELEQAESSSPGHVSQDAAAKFLAASRELGEAVNPTKYPTVAMIERETHFNAMNPFWQAPYALWRRRRSCSSQPGIRLGHRGSRRSLAIMGSTIYRSGSRRSGVGIALEIYGFYLRVRDHGLGPGDQHV